MAFEPLAGQRFVEVKDDHKAITWVGVIANLLDGPSAKCVKMTVVGDNLSAHKPSAFYTVFGASEGQELSGPTGVYLHSQAWLLAGHGRN